MRSIVSKTGLVFIGLLACFFLSGCPCNEYVKLCVFVGHRSASECESLCDKYNFDDVRYLCAGEEVTICWTSNVSQIQLEPGFGIKGSTGIEWLTVSADTTIKAIPISSCAGSKDIEVDVITEDTPSTWIGRWNSSCTKIVFEIHEECVSKKVKAIDITALWEPTLKLPDGSISTCSTPPFLDGFHQEEVYGFPIAKPNITEPFSRKLQAVGHWSFTWEARCAIDWKCNPYARFPFDITLRCPD